MFPRQLEYRGDPRQRDGMVFFHERGNCGGREGNSHGWILVPPVLRQSKRGYPYSPGISKILIRYRSSQDFILCQKNFVRSHHMQPIYITDKNSELCRVLDLSLFCADPDSDVGLKRKFSFSYFRENFAKTYFRFSRKKLTKSYENNENFAKKKMYENTDAGNGKYCEIS
jgi:hypothetical protein